MIYRNNNIRIEVEKSEIPWLKVFTVTPYAEMSQVPAPIRQEIYEVLDLIEREMIAYYHPDKINIASFGNYLPHVHWHIMARFKNDSYFPEPMWGEKQREGSLMLPAFDGFVKQMLDRLGNRGRTLKATTFVRQNRDASLSGHES